MYDNGFLELTGGNKDYQEVATVMTSFEKRGLEKGLKLGIEQGIEKGVERGKLEGLMETLIRILEKRFTRVSAADKKVVRQAATLSSLQQAIDAALDARSVKEVIASIRKR